MSGKDFLGYVDAHAHIKVKNAVYCTDTLLPYNLVGLKFDYLETLAKASISGFNYSEIGLDKRFINVISLDTQLSFFNYFFEYFINNSYPITLHCVRETGNMINYLSKKKFPNLSVLWHGFTGSLDVAKNLEKLGVIISLGKHKLEMIKEYKRANKYTVIETDYTGDNLEQYYSILEERYSVASLKLNVSKSVFSIECREILNIFKKNLDN